VTRRIAAAVVVAAMSAGCGLPTADPPERVPARRVPFGLLNADRAAAPLPARGPVALVYLVERGRLVSVARHVFGANVAAQGVRLVLAGPTSDEARQGITTDVPSQTRLISLDLIGRVATVDLSSEFGAVGGSDQVLAVAQIVWTLTSSPAVDAVGFSINGRPVDVPDGSGSLSATPRRRADFPAQAPRP
jgi:hypothetical protein